MSKLVVSSVSEVAFGGLSGTHLAGLDHDFVVVFGRNEAGKSTLAEFLAWLLVGPEGDAASARRFGDAGNMVGGRLNGGLEGKPVEINGTFKILDKGAPSDVPNKGQKAPRQGTIGGLNVDSQSLRERFGFTPQQYSLLLRFRAETMHLLENENLLLSMFSSYATGSVESSIQPRDVIEILEKRAKSMTAEIKSLTTQHGNAVKAVEEASRLPAEIREHEANAARLAGEETSLKERLEAINALVSVIKAAVDAFEKQQSLREAQMLVDGTTGVPAEWGPVIDSLGAVREAAQNVLSAQSQDDDIRPAALELSRSVGVSVADLATHTFTAQDRDAIRDSARSVQGALDELEALVSHEETLKSHHHPRSIAMREAILSATEPEDLLRARVTSLEDIRSAGLGARDADRAHERAHAAREKLRAAVSNRQEAERLIQNDHALSGVNPGVTRSSEVLPMAVLAVTLLVALGASFVQPVVGAIAGAIGVPLAFFLLRRKQGSADSGQHVVPADLHGALATRLADETAAETACRNADAEVETLLAATNTVLRSWGFSEATAGSAFAHVARIEGAVSAIADQVDADDALAASQDQIRDAERKVRVRQEVYTRLFTQRGIDAAPPLSSVDTWLDMYDRAVTAARKRVTALADLDDATQKLREYTERVPALKTAPTAHSVVLLVDDVIAMKDARDSAESSLAAARRALDDSVSGRQDVLAILESVHSLEELRWKLSDAEAERSEVDSQRTAVNQELGSVKKTIQELSSVEEVPALIEARETLADSISELARDIAVVTVAVESVQSVVEKFERENQGPVVETAQAIIDQVNPLFGRLVVEGSGDSRRLRVERSGTRIDVSKLSTGARTVVYLALRLAFLSMDAHNRTVALPLLCDDPVVNLDDERLEPAIALLHAESRNRQVLLFTCHQRTVDVARSIGAHVVNL